MLGMCLCRVDKLQTIQSRTAQPGSAQGWDMPPAEDIEKELYRRANTLEEYTKYSTFGHRFSKIVDSWHQNQVRSKRWDVLGQPMIQSCLSLPKVHVVKGAYPCFSPRNHNVL